MELKCFSKPALDIAVCADYADDGSFMVSAVPFTLPASIPFGSAEGSDVPASPKSRFWQMKPNEQAVFNNVWTEWIEDLRDVWDVRMWRSSCKLDTVLSNPYTVPVLDIYTLLDTAIGMGYVTAYPSECVGAQQRASEMAKEVINIKMYLEKVLSLATER